MGWKEVGRRALPYGVGVGVGLGVAGAGIGAGVAAGNVAANMGRPVPPVDVIAARPRYEPVPPQPVPKRRKEQEIDYGQWLPYYTSHSRYSAPDYFPRY